ncbi:MAG TPA: hypothetical protein VD993_15890 [Chitinophagaceae bacterium]|nr:hypothetical protein [Chitinophagaceae bacterium]
MKVDNTPGSQQLTGIPQTPKKRSWALSAGIATIIILLIGYLVFFGGAKEDPVPVAKTEKSATSHKHQDSILTENIVEEPVTNSAETKKQAPKETPNPIRYLTKSIKTHKNFVGRSVIEGSITNKSPNTIFKDAVLDVSYISKTGSVISTQRFVVYEIIKPGKKVNFKFKTKSPMGTKSYETDLVTAVIVK